MQRIETHEFEINFASVTVPRSSVPRRGLYWATIAHKQYKQASEIPLAELRFHYFGARADSSDEDVAWRVIYPALEKEINRLGIEGWELRERPNLSMLERTGGDNYFLGCLNVIPVLLTLRSHSIRHSIWMVWFYQRTSSHDTQSGWFMRNFRSPPPFRLIYCSGCHTDSGHHHQLSDMDLAHHQPQVHSPESSHRRGVRYGG